MWLIARREFRTRTFSKANLITSSIMLVLIVGGALILKPLISGGDGEPQPVEVSAETAALVPYLEAAATALEGNYEFVEVENPDETMVSEETAGLIVGQPTSPEVVLEGDDQSLVAVVTAAAQAAVLDSQVSELGGDPVEVSTAIAQATPTVTIVGEDKGADTGSYFAGLVVILVLFTVLIQSASVIMMGVVEEKSSRVVEILLATVRPTTLLGGKVLGVGLYALVQAVTLVVPLVFAAVYLDFIGELEIGLGALLVNFGVWFLLGFALFAMFFGGLAALVSRQEDLGAVTTPMMLLMLVPLYLAIYLVPNSPDGTVTMVLTQVPFFAPFMVPMRSAFGTIEPWEIALALTLCVLTIPLLTWLAGRVYAGAVLNTGGRMKLRDALRQG